jgi:4-hydroxy-tetrahydrodipicolinate synthase
VLETVITQTAERMPVVAGRTADGTCACIAYSRQARHLGAAALLASPPAWPGLNSEAVPGHYKALADADDIPLAVQADGVATEKGFEWISV